MRMDFLGWGRGEESSRQMLRELREMTRNGGRSIREAYVLPSYYYQLLPVTNYLDLPSHYLITT